MRCPRCGGRLLAEDFPFADDMVAVICADHQAALDKTKDIVRSLLYERGAEAKKRLWQEYHAILNSHCGFATRQWDRGFNEVFRHAFQLGIDLSPQPTDAAWEEVT